MKQAEQLQDYQERIYQICNGSTLQSLQSQVKERQSEITMKTNDVMFYKNQITKLQDDLVKIQEINRNLLTNIHEKDRRLTLVDTLEE